VGALEKNPVSPPGLMSFRSFVPPGFPSVRHSSEPWTPSLTANGIRSDYESRPSELVLLGPDGSGPRARTELARHAARGLSDRGDDPLGGDAWDDPLGVADDADGADGVS